MSAAAGRATRKQIAVLAGCFILLFSAAHIRTAVATSVSNISPEPTISFTFDDGLASSLTRAAPILAKYGFAGTSYIITSCVGTTGYCPANPRSAYMTWDQIGALQKQYKWEIGSHTVDHPSLTDLSPAKQEAQIAGSKQQLAEHGFTAVSFASPYGDYKPETIALSAKYYQSHRGFWDKGSNHWPYNEDLLAVQQLQGGVSLHEAKYFVDQAIATKQWLIFVFHDIKDAPSANPDDFEFATSELDELAAYIKQQQVKVTTIDHGSVTSNVNLLLNGGFSKGLSEGWSADQREHARHDSGNHGSYPEPKNSLLLTADSKPLHLYSPVISVDPHRTYMVKSFLNVIAIARGEVGYYVDEFDRQGRWISGQWKKAESSAFAEEINFPYTPSSSAVNKARVQVYVTAGSGIRAYVDSFQWFPMKQE